MHTIARATVITVPLALSLLSNAPCIPQAQVTGACECEAHFVGRSLSGFIAIFNLTKENADDACTDGTWISGVGDPPAPPTLIDNCEEKEETDSKCTLTGFVSVTHPTDHFYGYSEDVGESLGCSDWTLEEIRDGSNILVGAYAFSCSACEGD
jgi:hypothetical protein